MQQATYTSRRDRRERRKAEREARRQARQEWLELAGIAPKVARTLAG